MTKPPRVIEVQGVGKRKTYAGSWVETLNKAGYSCAGIDNRGCGRSSGLFGYVNDHTDWVNDLVSCTAQHGTAQQDQQQRASGSHVSISTLVHQTPHMCCSVSNEGGNTWRQREAAVMCAHALLLPGGKPQQLMCGF